MKLLTGRLEPVEVGGRRVYPHYDPQGRLEYYQSKWDLIGRALFGLPTGAFQRRKGRASADLARARAELRDELLVRYREAVTGGRPEELREVNAAIREANEHALSTEDGTFIGPDALLGAHVQTKVPEPVRRLIGGGKVERAVQQQEGLVGYPPAMPPP